MPRVRVAQVGKPCIRVKVRCNLLNVELQNAVMYIFWCNLVEKMIDWSFYWHFFDYFFFFFNFISSSCFDLAFGQRCYLKKHFNISWCKVITSSKKGIGLWSVIVVSWWRLVCVAKVGVWLLIGTRVITDVQIMTSTKAWSLTRMAANCILMFLNRRFKRSYVIFVF